MRRYASRSLDRDFRHGRDELCTAQTRFGRAQAPGGGGRLSGGKSRRTRARPLLARPRSVSSRQVRVGHTKPRFGPKTEAEEASPAPHTKHGSMPMECVGASSFALDNYYAFYSVQACAYLMARKKSRFETNVEKDMVSRLIGDAWRSLQGSGTLSGLSASRKLGCTENPGLPFFELRSERQDHRGISSVANAWRAMTAAAAARACRICNAAVVQAVQETSIVSSSDTFGKF